MKARFVPLITLIFIAMLSQTAVAQKGNEDAGLKKYGNVVFADSVHHKYPFNTVKQIRAAWSFIHVKNHAAKYTPEELKIIHSRIQDAASSHGIHFKSKD
jgi:hypothetical protein